MGEAVIKFENISKQYQLGTIGTGTLSHDLKRWWIVNVMGKEDPYLKIGSVNDRSKKDDSGFVWALKDINLEIKQGEVLGIIGKNGAGKSTLLKLLSRVTTPTTGRILAKGRIASLLEVGTGFHMEMTGSENIFMNGSIMGMTKVEIRKKFDEIVAFAGIERYVDTPVKRYSSGMVVRLGFAIAAHLEAEILLVDEVLAVGDAEFQKKAIGKMQDVSHKEGRTVFFVSHNMGSIQNLCSSGILLEKGAINFSGKIDQVINAYIFREKFENKYIYDRVKSNPIYIKSIVLQDINRNLKNSFLHTERIRINSYLIINEVISESYLLITILDKQKRTIFSAEKRIDNNPNSILEIDSNFLTRGTYSIQAIVYKPAVTQYDLVEDVCKFDIIDAGSHFAHLETFNYGCVFGNYKWIENL